MRLMTTLMMTFVLLTAGFMHNTAAAAVISSEQAIAAEDLNAKRQQVTDFLQRDDVAAELQRMGVSEQVALARVQDMSPAEINQLSTEIDEMPAGGIIGVLGVIFLVLLVLEVVGVTNVFNG